MNYFENPIFYNINRSAYALYISFVIKIVVMNIAELSWMLLLWLFHLIFLESFFPLLKEKISCRTRNRQGKIWNYENNMKETENNILDMLTTKGNQPKNNW